MAPQMTDLKERRALARLAAELSIESVGALLPFPSRGLETPESISEDGMIVISRWEPSAFVHATSLLELHREPPFRTRFSPHVS